MEYRDERDLHIYTDGSSYSGPRRGGIGILFVTADEAGEERVDAYPEPGYLGATNQQMELRAAIDAWAALVRGSAPVAASLFRRIVIWTDSMYLVDGYNSAPDITSGMQGLMDRILRGGVGHAPDNRAPTISELS
jgi:ribonuclease HI